LTPPVTTLCVVCSMHPVSRAVFIFNVFNMMSVAWHRTRPTHPGSTNLQQQELWCDLAELSWQRRHSIVVRTVADA
jgi:hypothetical protein